MCRPAPPPRTCPAPLSPGPHLLGPTLTRPHTHPRTHPQVRDEAAAVYGTKAPRDAMPDREGVDSMEYTHSVLKVGTIADYGFAV